MYFQNPFHSREKLKKYSKDYGVQILELKKGIKCTVALIEQIRTPNSNLTPHYKLNLNFQLQQTELKAYKWFQLT